MLLKKQKIYNIINDHYYYIIMKDIGLIISIFFTILSMLFVTTTFTYIPTFGDGLFIWKNYPHQQLEETSHF